MKLLIVITTLLFAKVCSSQSLKIVGNVVIAGAVTDTDIVVTIPSFNIISQTKSTATLHSANGSVLKTLWNDSIFPPGSYPIIWNGTTASGNTAPNGSYPVRIATDNLADAFGLLGNSISRKAIVVSNYIFVIVDSTGDLKVYNRVDNSLVHTITNYALTNSTITVDEFADIWIEWYYNGTVFQTARFSLNEDGTLSEPTLVVGGKILPVMLFKLDKY